ncbi:hypothetical protein BKH10_07560 [Actinomyces naeslundii]|nr:hypothetical protein BKH10_07560 [Actinomyces naeslundii]
MAAYVFRFLSIISLSVAPSPFIPSTTSLFGDHEKFQFHSVMVALGVEVDELGGVLNRSLLNIGDIADFIIGENTQVFNS